MFKLNKNHIFDYNLRELVNKINIQAPLLFNHSLKEYTSFKIGGPAELYTQPENTKELITIYSFCIKEKIPFFILGEGSNILVSDKGIKGIVIDTRNISGIDINNNHVESLSGTKMSLLAEKTVKRGLIGIENFYSMPGTLGGAVWINARCYNVSLSESLEYIDIIDKDLIQRRIQVKKSDFGYKTSPFQKNISLILKAGFNLKESHPAENTDLINKIKNYKEDRISKGHFLYPCAGSVFKNNRAFKIPSGKLIDSLELKGLSIGDAQVSEKHANIIVNRGNASAKDIYNLIQTVKKKVKNKYGFDLEEEIIYVGEI